MIDIIQYYKELSNLVPNGVDIIPDDFDFKNGNIAKEFKIGKSMMDTENGHCTLISLEVKLVGLKENKIKIINETMQLDKLLNNFKFSNLDWIVRENVWYSDYIDKDKFKAVLMYNIKKYS